MTRWKRWIIIGVTMGVLSGCFFGDQSPTENSSQELSVPIGFPGEEEDVVVHRYENDMLQLWAAESLTFVEEETSVTFYEETSGAQVTLTSNVQHTEEEVYRLQAELMENDYEQYNAFELDEHPGQGYIYYSEVDEQLIELYVIEGETSSLLVHVALPKEEMNTYVPLFQYMLDSIQYFH